MVWPLHWRVTCMRWFIRTFGKSPQVNNAGPMFCFAILVFVHLHAARPFWIYHSYSNLKTIPILSKTWKKNYINSSNNNKFTVLVFDGSVGVRSFFRAEEHFEVFRLIRYFIAIKTRNYWLNFSGLQCLTYLFNLIIRICPYNCFLLTWNLSKHLMFTVLANQSNWMKINKK